MATRRLWLSIASGVVALLLLLGAYATFQVRQLLKDQSIELRWQTTSLSLRGLQLSAVHLQQEGEGGLLSLSSPQLQLHWFAAEPPRYRLQAQGLQLSWQPYESRAPDSPPSDLQQQLRDLAHWLAWLPAQVDIQELQAHLPCASGRCTLAGALRLRREDEHLQGHLQLQRDAHRADLHATLSGLDNQRQRPLEVSAELQLDAQQAMTLDSQLRPLAQGADWSGQLAVPQLGDVAWVADWLHEWLLDTSPVPATPQHAHLNARWQLRLGTGGWNLKTLLGAPGSLRLDALLEQPWPVPGLGLLSGELAVDLYGDAGRWQAEQLSGDLRLSPDGAPWLEQIPAGLQPHELHLQIRPDGAPQAATGRLPLALSLSSQGPLQLHAEARLELSQYPHWQLELAQLGLELRSEQLRLEDLDARGLHLQLLASGSISQQQLDLTLGNGSTVALRQLALADLSLQQLQAELSGNRLFGPPATAELHGPLAMRVQRLQHPQLQPQGWQWRGTLQADTQQQRLTGDLQGDSGLNLALQLNRHAGGDITLDARLAELFLRAGNPLAQTLVAWPALLSLDNGRLQGSARLQLPESAPLQARMQLSAKGLGGLYDRSLFSGLEGDLALNIEKQRLVLELPNLTLKQLDPGIALGPLQLQARYQAPLAQPLAGRLQHQRAELGILGGTLRLAAADWQLDQPGQRLPLQLSGLDLEELFRVYPAEGLAGSGLIDGDLPLRLDRGTFSIEKGHIQARAPGGRLRFDSPRIRAMGQSNPGMKLVTDALEDFHYSLLDSSLDYDQSGTLRLGLRLQGQNPALEQGRPIHFTINLEEDIPTLLASLQLTDKVSEIIQQRIQQRMRERIPEDAKE